MSDNAHGWLKICVCAGGTECHFSFFTCGLLNLSQAYLWHLQSKEKGLMLWCFCPEKRCKRLTQEGECSVSQWIHISSFPCITPLVDDNVGLLSKRSRIFLEALMALFVWLFDPASWCQTYRLGRLMAGTHLECHKLNHSERWRGKHKLAARGFIASCLESVAFVPCSTCDLSSFHAVVLIFCITILSLATKANKRG